MKKSCCWFLALMLWGGASYGQIPPPLPPVPPPPPGHPGGVCTLSPGPGLPGMPDGRYGYGPMGPMGPEGRERLMMFRMWRLTEQLNLTEDQAARFFPLSRRYLEEDRKLNLKTSLSADSLRVAIDRDNVPESELMARMEGFRAVTEERAKLKASYLKDASGILSVRQQAGLLLFEERFQAELRDMGQVMRKVREQRGRAGGADLPGAGERGKKTRKK